MACRTFVIRSRVDHGYTGFRLDCFLENNHWYLAYPFFGGLVMPDRALRKMISIGRARQPTCSVGSYNRPLVIF